MRADAPNQVSPTGTQRRTKRDYWEMEREKLVAGLVQRVMSKGDHLALRELLAMDLPEILNVVLRNHAKSLVRNEKPLALQTNRRYELEDAEVRAQFRRLRDMLAQRIVFDGAELKPVFTFGVRLQFDLIVRPRAFLESLLYQHAKERERDDVLVILMGFHDARAFVATLIDRITAYAGEVLPKEVFSDICLQVEREVYGGNAVAAFMADVRAYQLYSQRLLGLNVPSEVLDNQLILAMLNERHLTELAESLLPEFAKKESWLVGEVQERLQEYETGAGFNVKAGKAAEIDIDNFLEEAAGEIESQLVQTSLRELRTARIAEAPSETEKIEAVVAQEASLPKASDNSREAQASTTGAPPAKRPLLRFDDEEPVMVSRAKLELQPAGPYPALAKLIDEKNRKLFIKSIFQRDEDAYADFIQRLELIQTWKEAKTLFDGELNRRKVNPYTKEAIRLSDVIFGRYFAKR